MYAVLDAQLVQDLIPDAVREFCGREVIMIIVIVVLTYSPVLNN